MTIRSDSERLAGRLQALMGQWESRQQAERDPELFQRSIPEVFTIALSRETGTRGTDVAEKVGELLRWPVYDHKLLERVAEEMGVRVKLLESVDERKGSWLREVFGDLLAVPNVSEPAYVHHLVQTVLALGVHGQCVIVGRGAAQILPEKTTLRVRLIASRRHRIEVVAERLRLSRPDAERQMDLLDQEHRSFVRRHFQKDPNDPSLYDLVVNTARFSVTDCASLVAQALEQVRSKAGGSVISVKSNA